MTTTDSKKAECRGCGYEWILPTHATVTGNDLCSVCVDASIVVTPLFAIESL